MSWLGTLVWQAMGEQGSREKASNKLFGANGEDGGS